MVAILAVVGLHLVLSGLQTDTVISATVYDTSKTVEVPIPAVENAQNSSSAGAVVAEADEPANERLGIAVLAGEPDTAGLQVSSAVHMWVTKKNERIGMLSPGRFTADGKIQHFSNGGPESLTCEAVERRSGARVVSQGESKCGELIGKLMQECDLSPRFEEEAAAADDAVDPSGGEWVAGTTVYMFLKASAGNIAHYAGRVLMIEHLVVHAGRMGLSSMRSVDRIVLQATPQVREQILKEGSWHHEALRAIVGKEINFFESSTGADLGGPGVYVFLDRDVLSVAFERLILPSFLKGRYFVPDSELDVGAAVEMVHGVERPSSASHWLKNVHQMLGRDNIPGMKKKVVYLRRLTRRAFTSDSEQRVTTILRDVCRSRGFEYEEVVLSGAMGFRGQVGAVEDAAVAVGLHGANLVQTLALPRGAAMIEIFPFGWRHDMYVEGGCAGVHYTALNVSRGDEFAGLETDFGGDRYQCIAQAIACKNFYRSDVRPVELPAEDAVALKTALTASIDHALLSLSR